MKDILIKLYKAVNIINCNYESSLMGNFIFLIITNIVIC